ncbi:MAG: hypothetical protein ACOCXN_11800 [Spirochaetota bacterium]
MTPDAIARLRRLPRIKRARGYRLYAVDGRRLLDMWQAGGRAILGHRGAGVITEMKRVLERGVLAPLPSQQEQRLEQALRRLFGDQPERAGGGGSGSGDFRFAVFANEERARAAVSRALSLDMDATLPWDPALGPNAGARLVRYWRPFLPSAAETGAPSTAHDGRKPSAAWADSDSPVVVLPVLPDGGLSSAQVVVYRAGSGVQLDSDLLPEPLLRGLAVASDALRTATAPGVIRLANVDMIGPYVRLATASEASPRYDDLFDALLADGIVISPDPASPSIIPGELSDGELRRIERAFAGTRRA